jgi:hypothetical protein
MILSVKSLKSCGAFRATWIPAICCRGSKKPWLTSKPWRNKILDPLNPASSDAGFCVENGGRPSKKNFEKTVKKAPDRLQKQGKSCILSKNNRVHARLPVFGALRRGKNKKQGSQ